MLEHGVEDDEQLAHTSDQGQLLRLASGQQPLVEVPDDRIDSAPRRRSLRCYPTLPTPVR